MKEFKELIKKNSNIIGYSGLFLLLSWFLISQIETVPGILSKIILALAAVTLIGYILLEYEKIIGFFKNTKTKKGLQISVTLFFITGILILFYYIAVRNTLLRVDLTSNKRFSLSQQTEQVLKGLKQDVKFYIFKINGHASSRYVNDLNNILTEFKMQKRSISVEIVDMQEEPALTKQYGIRIPATVVIVMGKKKKILTYRDYLKQKRIGQKVKEVGNYEAAITSALLIMTLKEQNTVYFIKGHKEKDINSQYGGGAAYARYIMEKEGLIVKSTNLLFSKKVPADCDLLIIAGGEDNIRNSEIKMIDQYLMEGRPAIFMAERGASASYKNLISRWGVKVNNDTVIDKTRFAESYVIVVPKFVYHPIVAELAKEDRFPAMVMASSLEKSPAAKLGKDNRSPFSVRPILRSSKDAWGETVKLSPTAKIGHSAGEKKGELVMAYAVIRSAAKVGTKKGKPVILKPGPRKRLRLVVFGDSDFIANDYLPKAAGNADLLLNTVNWALGQEKSITIRPKAMDDYRLKATPLEINIIKIVAKVIIPLFIIVPGLFVYFRRRKNG